MSAFLSSLKRFTAREGLQRELLLFGGASLLMGMSYSMFDSVFNNFLNDRFALSGFQRSFLEFPRELPGFLVLFVSAALWFLALQRLGAVSLVLSAVGALLIGYLSPSYWVMVGWLFIYSMGQHLYMPVASTVGMQLAREGRTGARLGQLNAIRNLAAVVGSFVVSLGFRSLGFTFSTVFTMAAVGFLLAALLLSRMKAEKPVPSTPYLKLHKRYRLYYILTTLSGARKQFFITFAPWVLVTVFNQPTAILATLFGIGGVIGILFQPLLGWAVDKLGERTVLVTEAVILIFVCAGYGFSKFVLPERTAFLVVCGFFLLDQMLMSVSMARTTYIKKIARTPAEIQPTLAAGVTIDHIFSISGALLGGLIWNRFGFQYVFLLGAVVALLTVAAAWQVKIPEPEI